MNNVINLNEYKIAKANAKENVCPICGSKIITKGNESCSCTKCLFSFDNTSSFTDMTGLNEFDICVISNYLKENPYVDITNEGSIWGEIIDCYSRGKDYLGEIFVSYLNCLYRKC